MKTLSYLLVLFSLTGTASANVSPPAEIQSRALQLARRVAAMENGHDLPSRAVWLGQRVAKNSERLEVDAEKKTARKAVKKTKDSEQN
jgi:hypothetical protein